MDDTKNRRKYLPEWEILDIIFGIGIGLYLLAQLLIMGYIADTLFVILLAFATIFLNYRQWDLYRALTNEEGKKFFLEIYSLEEHEKQVNNIFLCPMDRYISVIFAGLFSVVMWGFDVWRDSIALKLCFSLFLFTANIPTGYAILRILKYFYYNILWIKKLDFELGLTNHFSERYIKRICSKVLFTATTYCTVSLSSILFTEIELNIIVVVYTIFAAILVLTALSLTNILLRKEMQKSILTAVDEINVKIASLTKMVFLSDEKNDEAMDKMRELIEIKDYVAGQARKRFDFSKFLSSIGLLLITVIPVILQWVLEMLVH